jgi:hypothetical protein
MLGCLEWVEDDEEGDLIVVEPAADGDLGDEVDDGVDERNPNPKLFRSSVGERSGNDFVPGVDSARDEAGLGGDFVVDMLVGDGDKVGAVIGVECDARWEANGEGDASPAFGGFNFETGGDDADDAFEFADEAELVNGDLGEDNEDADNEVRGDSDDFDLPASCDFDVEAETELFAEFIKAVGEDNDRKTAIFGVVLNLFGTLGMLVDSSSDDVGDGALGDVSSDDRKVFCVAADDDDDEGALVEAVSNCLGDGDGIAGDFTEPVAEEVGE